MKRVLLIFPLILVGCSSTTNPQSKTVVKEVPVVIAPSENMLQCPAPPEISKDLSNMTNEDVSKLLLELANNNIVCHSSMEAIKNYIRDAKRRIR